MDTATLILKLKWPTEAEKQEQTSQAPEAEFNTGLNRSLLYAVMEDYAARPRETKFEVPVGAQAAQVRGAGGDQPPVRHPVPAGVDPRVPDAGRGEPGLVGGARVCRRVGQPPAACQELNR